MANGIIVIDKAPDWTSHDVVAKLRGILREKRIGHAGTLDPMATGVLPVFVGRATRAVEFAAETGKEYVAGLKLGLRTDTQDSTGTILETRPVSVTPEQLEAALEPFRGDILQMPPMYSALKRDGKKLYELARRGIEVERAPRPITIYELQCCTATAQPGEVPPAVVPDYYLRVKCSKGTYIRTLCNDIGETLGCGGVMCSLRRVEAAGFTLQDAVTLDEVQKSENPLSFLRPIDTYFQKLPALQIDGEALRLAKNGNPFPSDALPGDYRVYDPMQNFLLVGHCADGVLTTTKSFFEV
ncbi:MAG: tRNA pseudouridine(55) synthase TruB [Oscillospiraceae bacterium]